MATDITGSNSDKIDKLVATIVELRTIVRICFGIIGAGFPLMIGLLTFLVVQSFVPSARLDRMADRYDTLSARIEQIERQVGTRGADASTPPGEAQRRSAPGAGNSSPLLPPT